MLGLARADWLEIIHRAVVFPRWHGVQALAEIRGTGGILIGAQREGGTPLFRRGSPVHVYILFQPLSDQIFEIFHSRYKAA